MGNVFSFVPDVSSATGAGSDIIRLLDSEPEIDDDSPEGKAIEPEKTQGQMRFEDVHFRYPTRPGVRVLRGLSLHVDPGTYVAHDTSPTSYLPAPKDPRELESRRRTWWMTIIFDRIVSVGGWIHAVQESALGTELPLTNAAFEKEVGYFCSLYALSKWF